MQVALLTKTKLAEHLALPLNTSAAYKVFKDEEGHTYIIFPSGFDLIEFDVKFPGLFSDCPKQSWNTYEDTFYIGRIH